MYRVARSFKFDSAHRLFGYPGKCKHIHGHSYVAQVTVQGEKLDELSMLVDFSLLKRLGDWINEWWDHNILLTKVDPLWQSMPDANEGRMPFSTYKFLPTAEAMCKLLYEQATVMLGPSSELRVVKIRIYETEDCWAEYSV